MITKILIQMYYKQLSDGEQITLLFFTEDYSEKQKRNLLSIRELFIVHLDKYLSLIHI